MTPEVLAAIAAVLLALVGMVGIVFPVLPGSIVVAVGALIWALWGASPWGWVAFGCAAAFLAAGAASSWFLTGRSLKRRQVPQWPIAIGIVVGIIAMFLMPGIGLPVGFVVGLLAAEWFRLRDFGKALATSWETVKALGLGIVVELGCAMTATMITAVSIATAAW
ncbi:MAG: DUF456 domain-containing protein [Arachnia sp.]